MRWTRATPDQVEAIEVQDRVRFPGADPPKRGTVWWVLGGDAAQGYCGARATVADRVDLERVYVAPALRGRGLQRRAIRVRERWGRDQGARVAKTYTWTGNIGSMRSLIAMGYTIEARTWDGTHGWLHWTRDL